MTKILLLLSTFAICMVAQYPQPGNVAGVTEAIVQTQNCGYAGQTLTTIDTLQVWTCTSSGIPGVWVRSVTATTVKNLGYVLAAGTNTYTGTTATPFPTYGEGLSIQSFCVANANTGASTLNIGGQGAVPITKNGGTALAGGELAAGGCYPMTYRASLGGFDFIVAASSGGGITALTGDVTASGTGSVPATIQKINNLSVVLPAAITAGIMANWPMTNCDGTAIANVISTAVPDCPLGGYAGGNNPGILNNHGGSGQPLGDTAGLSFVSANKQSVDLTVSGGMTGLRSIIFIADVDPTKFDNFPTASWVPLMGTLTLGSGSVGASFDLRNNDGALGGVTGMNSASKPEYENFAVGNPSNMITGSDMYCFGVCAIQYDLFTTGTTDVIYVNNQASQGYIPGPGSSLSVASFSTGAGVTMMFGGHQAGGGTTGYYTGKIYHAIAFNIILTATQRAQVFNYLMDDLRSKGIVFGPGSLQATPSTPSNILVSPGDSLTQGFGGGAAAQFITQPTTISASIVTGATSCVPVVATSFFPNQVVTIGVGLATQEDVITTNAYLKAAATLLFVSGTIHPHYIGETIQATYLQFPNDPVNVSAPGSTSPWITHNYGRGSLGVRGMSVGVPGILSAFPTSNPAIKNAVATIWGCSNDIRINDGTAYGQAPTLSSPELCVETMRAMNRMFKAAGYKTVGISMLSAKNNTSGGIAGILSVPIISGGSGMTSCTVVSTGGGGTIGVATAVIVGGSLVAINMPTLGFANHNYTSAPVISLTGTNCSTPVLGTPIMGGVGNLRCSANTGTVEYDTGLLQCTSDSGAQKISELLAQYGSEFDAYMDPFRTPIYGSGGYLGTTTTCGGSLSYYHTDNNHLSTCGYQFLSKYLQKAIYRALGHADNEGHRNFTASTITAATYTIPDDVFNLWVNPSTNPQTITLTDAWMALGDRRCVTNLQLTGANTVTVATQTVLGTTQTINGATTTTVANAATLCVTSDGLNWFIR